MKIFSFFIISLTLFSVASADFTSTNFILENPINIIEGGQSSSASFQYISSTGQLTSGQSTSGSFTQNAGFLYFPDVSVTPPVVPGGGGGGGGSDGGGQSNTGVNFSGRAYPLSKVSILKDGQLALSTIAGPDANFNATIGDLSEGDYTFFVYGEDKNGLRSSPFIFQVFITSGVTTKISGIFITPTIAVDKSEVKRGDNIAIFGQSVPTSEITISVNSHQEFFQKVNSDSGGVYLLNFDTSVLEIEEHNTKSKAAIFGEISSFGKTIGFTVGTQNIPITLAQKCPVKGDLNDDCKVNLIDFSIAAFWYKRPLSQAFISREITKLNGDGKVDLVDFSIMAFYWTG